MKTYLEQSKGERMVRASFNPSQEGNVAHIKRMFANAIDSLETVAHECCEKIHNTEMSDEEKALRCEEVHQCMYDAQHYIASASTRAVMAATAIM
jgi:hypothetical protein